MKLEGTYEWELSIFKYNLYLNFYLYLNSILGQYPYLHQFELTQLANLVPASVEEAVALIPSLKGKFSEEEIAEMVNQCNEVSII